MLETSDYRLVLVLRAIDGLRQMSGRSGNELIINRDQVLYDGEAVGVPSVSANSMRHAAVREPGGLWLIDAYELAGTLKKEMLRLLTNGGNNATLSGGAESLSRFVAMRESLPLLGLMGCGLPDSPKPGVLKFSAATLICRETREYVGVIAPELDLPEWLRPARLCVGKWTEYRHDPTQQRPDLLADPNEVSRPAKDGSDKNSSMPYGGEEIVPGCLLVSEIHLESATPLELGALLWSLRLWQAAGGFVGGMSAKGNGRTTAMLWSDLDDGALADAAASYVAYAVESRDAAVAWLHETYSSEPKAKGRGKKQKELIA
jgi:hypothetical protein